MNLCNSGNTLLENIRKSYKRGFSTALKVKHGNSLIGWINEYIEFCNSLSEGDPALALIVGEWEDVKINANLGFARLGFQRVLPEEIPAIPLLLFSEEQVRTGSVPVTEDLVPATDNSVHLVNNFVSVESELGAVGGIPDELEASFSARHNSVSQDIFKKSTLPLINPSQFNLASTHDRSVVNASQLQLPPLTGLSLPAAQKSPPRPKGPPPAPPVGQVISHVNRSIVTGEEMAETFYNLADRIVKFHYDGDPSKLTSFLDSITLLDAHVTDQQLAVNFIKTRIVGEARDLITTEASLTDVANTLRANIRVPTSADLLSKLAGVKHRQQPSLDFVKEVDNLAAMLKRSYIKEGVALATANEYTTREVTKTLMSNAPTQHAKAVLDAKPFTSPAEATAKYVDLVKDSPATVLRFNRGRGFRRGDNRNGANNYRDRRNYRDDRRDRRDNRDNRGRGNRRDRGNSRRVRVVNPENGEGPREAAGDLANQN